MPSVRVHELAKEFNMNSTELLKRLQDMKIPVKTHSSTLVDAYIDRIKKQLAPEIEQRAAEAEAARAAEEAARIEAEAKQAAEEAARIEAEAKQAAEEAARIEEETAQKEAELCERDTSSEGQESMQAAAAALAAPLPLDETSGAKVKAEALVEAAPASAAAIAAPAAPAAIAAPAAASSDALGTVTASASHATGKEASSTGAPTPAAAAQTGTLAQHDSKPGSPSVIAEGTSARVATTPTATTTATAAAASRVGEVTVAAHAASEAPADLPQMNATSAVPARTAPVPAPAVPAPAVPAPAVPAPVVDSGAVRIEAAASETAAVAASSEATASEQQPTKGPIKPPPRFTGLLSQIEAERERLEAEKEQKRRAAAEAKAAKGKASRQGTDGAGALGATGRTAGHGGASGAAAGASAAGHGQGQASTARHAGAHSEAAPGTALVTDDVLSGVATAAGEQGSSERKSGKGKRSHGAERSEATEAGRRKTASKEAKRGGSAVAPTPALRYTPSYGTDEDSSEDERYRQMALDAEQLQRERVLAEARAAVDAATGDEGGRRRKRREKRVAEKKERAELEAIEKGLDPDIVLDSSLVQITTGVTVQEFADTLGVASNDVVKKLFLLGSPLTVTQTMTDELVELIADDLDKKIRIVSPEEEYAIQIQDDPNELRPRPPVVTVMGHVDHGKTSLLDAIRETGVVATEAGGITQHIGASIVEINDRRITFIDTPGHEAFTAMRARGAKVTDVVVLVVAADDGVMPQTVEAIHHAEAAGVPIVVAINKIDKPGATPDRVRQELGAHSIIPEEWGGQNMFVEVSAKMRTGIDDLLETILLQADVLELKANPDALASGFVIEAKLDKGRGPVATVLVQRGTLKVSDNLVVGTAHGRVRALISPKGDNVTEAQPADPVEVLGLNS
ncbi:MAG: translation initiation factor IF-2, partial [Coriobacteriales bacterium]|nr:translation initiation factor IF-2 [Coriobacteriales bacterium]